MSKLINVASFKYRADTSSPWQELVLTGDVSALADIVSDVEDLKTSKAKTDASNISSASDWRSALGLGTSGALPLTIEQGGTGQTAVSELTSVVTAATGFQIVSSTIKKWGKLAQIYVTAKRTGTSITSNSTITIGTITLGGNRPALDCPLTIEGTTIIVSYIRNTGAIACYGTWSQNTQLAMYATYLLP